MPSLVLNNRTLFCLKGFIVSSLTYRGNLVHSPGYFHVYFLSSFNSFPASDYFCRLLIIFANNLDPDQARCFVGPDLDPNCLTL